MANFRTAPSKSRTPCSLLLKRTDCPKVEIDYIQKKHVKKPGGAKPGFVVYYTNYSLMAEPDISGISEASDEEIKLKKGCDSKSQPFSMVLSQ